MGLFAAGQIIVVSFPYSDFTKYKSRPALLVANAGRGDWIVCQITSNPYSAATALALTSECFSAGGLPHVSYVRPAKLNTIHESKFLTVLGTLTTGTLAAVRAAVILAITG